MAILWVILFRSFSMSGLGENWLWLSRFGWMGVHLFFVLSGFLCGVALAAWNVTRPASWQAARRFATASTALGLLVMAIAITLFQNRVGLLANSVGWPVLSLGLGLLVFAAAGRDNPLGRARIPLAGWLAGWLAAISFSLYLAHKAAYHVVYTHWGQQLSTQGPWAFAVYGLTAIAAGAALHYAVERPGLLVRKWVLKSQ